MAERPLAGVRVLELARVLAGPWIGQTLADLGADVIKVEAPEGDETRGWGPPFAADGAAAYFHACNRGKRGVALDFREPLDLERARRLAAGAEVVVENFKVGGLAKFGLDYASVAAGNPGVVYASVTGFGQDGPYAARAGYDFIIQAMGGIMDLTGEPDGPPEKPGVAYADLFTGLYGTVAVLAALRLRDASGRGQWIDLSLFDTQLAVLANQAANFLIGGVVPRRMGNAHPNIAPYQVFEAADGPLVDRLRQRRAVRAAVRGPGAGATTRGSGRTATGSRTGPTLSWRWRRGSGRCRGRKCWRRWRRAGCQRGRSTPSPRRSPSRRRWRGARCRRSADRAARAARCASPMRTWRRTCRRRGSTSTATRSGRPWRRARRGRRAQARKVRAMPMRTSPRSSRRAT